MRRSFCVKGNDKNNEINSVKVTPEGTFGFNPAFDITLPITGQLQKMVSAIQIPKTRRPFSQQIKEKNVCKK